MNVFGMIRFADLFSLFNCLFGFGAMLAASRGNIVISALLVMLAAASDGIDGFLARRMKSGELGQSLDCLADLISFGVAPAMLALTTFEMSMQAVSVSIIYLICGILRLARFNVSARDDKFFEGFPITASGVAVAACIMLNRSQILLPLMLISAALMVSSIPYAKIRDTRLVIASIVIFLIAASFALITGDAALSGAMISALMAAYMVSPVVISCLQRER